MTIHEHVHEHVHERGQGPWRIGLVAATAAGRRHAAVLAEAWPHARLIQAKSVASALRQAWSGSDAVVAFLATGAVVRILAPLLTDKTADPAVVVVDEAARHAIALLGGHAGGANLLAEQVAGLLDAAPVISTASDAAGLPGLDTAGMPVEGAVAAVGRALLDGLPVRCAPDQTWPLPAWPGTVSVGHRPPDGDACQSDDDARRPDGDYRLLVSDRVTPPDGRTAVLRPPSLVVGVGGSRGVPASQILDLLEGALADAGLSRASIRCLATADLKADEPGILEAAAALGLPLVTHTVAALAAVEVPNPSEVVRAAVGTPSVAEAAALLGGGGAVGGSSAAQLVVTKRAGEMGTLAIARHAPRGRLAIVGLGPGARDLLTPRAVAELRRASVVVGLDQYVDQVRDLLRPGTRVLSSGLGAEEARARAAVEQATEGHAVALIGSGDAGVYAMASPALEFADTRIDVVAVPGVTAGLAASALLGAPLGHDHVYLSLSDLHTPWEIIARRVTAAAAADLVVLFYNPRSGARDWQLTAALAELAAHRPPDTPVGVVRNASRPDERIHLGPLDRFDPSIVDMYSLVVVGSSRTRIVAGRMVTPRGYRWLS